MMILIPWSVQMTSINKRDEPQEVVTLTPTHPIFHREALQQRKTQGNSQEQRNSHSRNSGDGGDEDPSKGDIEKSHTTPIHPKIKREIVQKVGQEVPESELKTWKLML
jgi:hypothetical protein